MLFPIFILLSLHVFEVRAGSESGVVFDEEKKLDAQAQTFVYKTDPDMLRVEGAKDLSSLEVSDNLDAILKEANSSFPSAGKKGGRVNRKGESSQKKQKEKEKKRQKVSESELNPKESEGLLTIVKHTFARKKKKSKEKNQRCEVSDDQVSMTTRGGDQRQDVGVNQCAGDLPFSVIMEVDEKDQEIGVDQCSNSLPDVPVSNFLRTKKKVHSGEEQVPVIPTETFRSSVIMEITAEGQEVGVECYCDGRSVMPVPDQAQTVSDDTGDSEEGVNSHNQFMNRVSKVVDDCAAKRPSPVAENSTGLNALCNTAVARAIESSETSSPVAETLTGLNALEARASELAVAPPRVMKTLTSLNLSSNLAVAWAMTASKQGWHALQLPSFLTENGVILTEYLRLAVHQYIRGFKDEQRYLGVEMEEMFKVSIEWESFKKAFSDLKEFEGLQTLRSLLQNVENILAENTLSFTAMIKAYNSFQEASSLDQIFRMKGQSRKDQNFLFTKYFYHLAFKLHEVLYMAVQGSGGAARWEMAPSEENMIMRYLNSVRSGFKHVLGDTFPDSELEIACSLRSEEAAVVKARKCDSNKPMIREILRLEDFQHSVLRPLWDVEQTHDKFYLKILYINYCLHTSFYNRGSIYFCGKEVEPRRAKEVLRYREQLFPNSITPDWESMYSVIRRIFSIKKEYWDLKPLDGVTAAYCVQYLSAMCNVFEKMQVWRDLSESSVLWGDEGENLLERYACINKGDLGDEIPNLPELRRAYAKFRTAVEAMPSIDRAFKEKYDFLERQYRIKARDLEDIENVEETVVKKVTATDTTKEPLKSAIASKDNNKLKSQKKKVRWVEKNQLNEEGSGETLDGKDQDQPNEESSGETLDGTGQDQPTEESSGETLDGKDQDQPNEECSKEEFVEYEPKSQYAEWFGNMNCDLLPYLSCLGFSINLENGLPVNSVLKSEFQKSVRMLYNATQELLTEQEKYSTLNKMPTWPEMDWATKSIRLAKGRSISCATFFADIRTILDQRKSPGVLEDEDIILSGLEGNVVTREDLECGFNDIPVLAWIWQKITHTWPESAIRAYWMPEEQYFRVRVKTESSVSAPRSAVTEDMAKELASEKRDIPDLYSSNVCGSIVSLVELRSQPCHYHQISIHPEVCKLLHALENEEDPAEFLRSKVPNMPEILLPAEGSVQETALSDLLEGVMFYNLSAPLPTAFAIVDDNLTVARVKQAVSEITSICLARKESKGEALTRVGSHFSRANLQLQGASFVEVESATGLPFLGGDKSVVRRDMSKIMPQISVRANLQNILGENCQIQKDDFVETELLQVMQRYYNQEDFKRYVLHKAWVREKHAFIWEKKGASYRALLFEVARKYETPTLRASTIVSSIQKSIEGLILPLPQTLSPFEKSLELVSMDFYTASGSDALNSFYDTSDELSDILPEDLKRVLRHRDLYAAPSLPGQISILLSVDRLTI